MAMGEVQCLKVRVSLDDHPYLPERQQWVVNGQPVPNSSSLVFAEPIELFVDELSTAEQVAIVQESQHLDKNFIWNCLNT